MVLYICTIAAVSIAVAQDRQTKVFAVKKGGTLTVKLTGNITVVPWDKEEAEINIIGSDPENMAEKLRFENENGNVTIELKEGDSWCDDCDYQFHTPSVYNLSLYTVGGDIHIMGALKGNAKVVTKGGDIKTGDCDGNVDVTTAGGDIFTGTITGNVSFHTAGGDIKSGNIGGDAAISTASGDVVIGNITKSASISTAGGEIRLGEIGGDLKTSTAGGDVIIRKADGQVQVSTAGGDVRVGSGNIYTKVSTAGGNVSLDNIHGSVNASSAGGDVSVRFFPEGTEESKLTSAVGKITLVLPETVKATVMATVKGIMPEDFAQKIVCEFATDKSTEVKDNKKNQRVFFINGGGQKINLQTFDSIIEIKKIK
jgi:hypothetical protein